MKNTGPCHGDNFNVNVVSMTEDHFEMGMSMAFNGNVASLWAETKRWGLVYFWWVDKSEGLRGRHSHYDPRGDHYQYHGQDDETTVYSLDSSASYWEEDYTIKRFDKPKSVGELLQFTKDWLETAEYEEQPDHDGLNSKGFTISTGDFWGHIGNHRGAICFIKPTWIMHGK